MKECIFCKIIEGAIPSVKIWEDKTHVAILGNHPNTEGMTLVLTKKHYDSYAFDMPEKAYSDLMNASRKVAKLLEKGLKVQRVGMIMEGMGINHIHIKLYPMHGLKDKFTEMWAPQEVFFEKYEGYLTTEEGQEWSIEQRQKVAEEIKKNLK